MDRRVTLLVVAEVGEVDRQGFPGTDRAGGRRTPVVVAEDVGLRGAAEDTDDVGGLDVRQIAVDALEGVNAGGDRDVPRELLTGVHCAGRDRLADRDAALDTARRSNSVGLHVADVDVREVLRHPPPLFDPRQPTAGTRPGPFERAAGGTWVDHADDGGPQGAHCQKLADGNAPVVGELGPDRPRQPNVRLRAAHGENVSDQPQRIDG